MPEFLPFNLMNKSTYTNAYDSVHLGSKEVMYLQSVTIQRVKREGATTYRLVYWLPCHVMCKSTQPETMDECYSPPSYHTQILIYLPCLKYKDTFQLDSEKGSREGIQ